MYLLIESLKKLGIHIYTIQYTVGILLKHLVRPPSQTC